MKNYFFINMFEIHIHVVYSYKYILAHKKEIHVVKLRDIYIGK